MMTPVAFGCCWVTLPQTSLMMPPKRPAVATDRRQERHIVWDKPRIVLAALEAALAAASKVVSRTTETYSTGCRGVSWPPAVGGRRRL